MHVRRTEYQNSAYSEHINTMSRISRSNFCLKNCKLFTSRLEKFHIIFFIIISFLLAFYWVICRKIEMLHLLVLPLSLDLPLEYGAIVSHVLFFSRAENIPFRECQPLKKKKSFDIYYIDPIFEWDFFYSMDIQIHINYMTLITIFLLLLLLCVEHFEIWKLEFPPIDVHRNQLNMLTHQFERDTITYSSITT